MQKRWHLLDQHSEQEIEKLSKALKVNTVMAQLMLQRGIDSEDKARSFFNPNPLLLHNPFLMKNMELAVERLKKAIDGGQKVMLYGDYDVDGIHGGDVDVQILGPTP